MIKSESFPIFMLLPLTGFTDYSEAVFSIDSHWVFYYKSSLYYHTRVELIFFFSISIIFSTGSAILLYAIICW